MKNKPVLRWLWRVSGGDKGIVLLMSLLQMLFGAAAVMTAWFLKEIINAAVDKNTGAFWQCVLGFVLLTVGQITVRAILRHLAESCRSSLENRFKGRLFGVLLSADYGRVSTIHSGEWMNRLTSDVVVVADGLSGILPEISGMLIRLVGALCLLMVLIPWSALLILPVGAALLLLTFVFRKKLKSLHKTVQEADGDLRAYLTERLGAMLVIRAFGRQDAVQRDSDGKMAVHRKARMQKNAFSNVCNIGFAVALRGFYVFAAAVCGYGILSGTMSYGTFTAVLQLVSQIQNPFANLSGFVPRYYAMLASAERLMEAEGFAADCAEESLTEERANALYQTLQKVELRDVSFTYPEDSVPVLSHRDVSICRGNYVAFTGHSGCGKSTVLKLLLSLYTPSEGACMLVTENGEQPLTAAHRALFSYVPQGNALMNGTIRQVLTFGETTVPEEELWNALEIACAKEFVQQQERGMDTLLGERGAGLSEGQIQRLAIARAVLSNRPILLLDEATSALDEATEAAVLKNLQRMSQKTVIIVTHRPAALAICNQEVHFG